MASRETVVLGWRWPLARQVRPSKASLSFLDILASVTSDIYSIRAGRRSEARLLAVTTRPRQMENKSSQAARTVLFRPVGCDPSGEPGAGGLLSRARGVLGEAP